MRNFSEMRNSVLFWLLFVKASYVLPVPLVPNYIKKHKIQKQIQNTKYKKQKQNKKIQKKVKWRAEGTEFF